MHKTLAASLFKVQDYTVTDVTVKVQTSDTSVKVEDIAQNIIHLGCLPECRNLKAIQIVQTRKVLIVNNPAGRDILGEFPY